MNQNKPYNRIDRVNNQVLDVINDILLKNINLSNIGFITISCVKVAPDLRSAKIFYSVINPRLPLEKTNIELNKKRKAFKKFMGLKLQLKHIPDLRFYYDETYTYEKKIEKLIKNIKTNKK